MNRTLPPLWLSSIILCAVAMAAEPGEPGAGSATETPPPSETAVLSVSAPLHPTTEQLKAENSSNLEKLTTLQNEFNEKQGELAKLTEELTQKSKALEQAESKEASKKAVGDWLTGELTGTGASLRRNGDIVVVDVPAAEYSVGKLKPSKELDKSLKVIAQAAVRFGAEFDLIVEGHADKTPVREGGKFRDNWDVAYERAYEMAKMIQGQISKQDGIAITSRGSNLPGDASKDRRVEFLFVSKRTSDGTTEKAGTPVTPESGKTEVVAKEKVEKEAVTPPKKAKQKEGKGEQPGKREKPVQKPAKDAEPGAGVKGPEKAKKDLDSEE